MRGRPLDNYSPTRDVVAPTTRWVGRTYGRYRVRGVVERDAESTTLLADERAEDGPSRRVWLRCLERSAEKDEGARQRFEHEAGLCLATRHMNLVAGLGRASVDGQPAIALEYPGRRTWGDVLRQCRNQSVRVPPALAVLVASRVAAGLDHAHRMTNPDSDEPVVHGGVRAEVIHIDDEGWVRLSGFGREARPASKAALLESLRHLAPEQSLGERTSASTDVYALSVVLAESLGGRPLFPATEPKTLLADVVRGQRPPMNAWLGFRATALEEALERGLSPRPDARYPTAAAFAWALERAMAQLGVLADEAELAEFVAGLTKTTGDLVAPLGLTRPTPPPPPPPHPEELVAGPVAPAVWTEPMTSPGGRPSVATPLPEPASPVPPSPRGAAPLDAGMFVAATFRPRPPMPYSMVDVPPPPGGEAASTATVADEASDPTRRARVLKAVGWALGLVGLLAAGLALV